MTLTAFTRQLVAGLTLTLGVVATVSAQSPADAPLPTVQHGRIERWANWPSKLVDARHVDIWLPDGYTPAKRYAVLYMHDGQMLYDARTTWNKQAWSVQDALTRLRAAGRIRDVIVVGVWNNGKWRHSEYMPQAFLPGLPADFREALVRDGLQGKPQSDAYLRFLVEELKPAIDARYATRPDRDNTFIMGSSMGGLISVYAMNRYPEVFGGAAGLSTHWVGIFKPNAALPLAAFNYLREHLADPATHRLYQDYGTIELDALYAPYQSLVNSLARERGYVDGNNFLALTFEGTGHNETAWAQRVETPLAFLLRP
jgi:enterochelin esterase-like enzyme